MTKELIGYSRKQDQNTNDRIQHITPEDMKELHDTAITQVCVYYVHTHTHTHTHTHIYIYIYIYIIIYLYIDHLRQQSQLKMCDFSGETFKVFEVP